MKKLLFTFTTTVFLSLASQLIAKNNDTLEADETLINSEAKIAKSESKMTSPSGEKVVSEILNDLSDQANNAKDKNDGSKTYNFVMDYKHSLSDNSIFSISPGIAIQDNNTKNSQNIISGSRVSGSDYRIRLDEVKFNVSYKF